MTAVDNRTYAENRPIASPYSQGHQVPLAMEVKDGPGVSHLEALRRPVEPTKVPLDDMKKDLEDLALADKLLAEWEATRKIIRKRIADRLGPNGVGTVAGVEVWAHTPTERFAVAKFAKEQPEIAAQFTEHKVVTEVNQDRLKAEMPVLFAEYQVSSLRPLGSRA